jgi:hypothetical protein
MAGTDIHQPASKVIKTDTEGTTVKVAHISLGKVIANHLDSVMIDRTNMRSLEMAVETWVKEELDHSLENRTLVLGQLKTAMGCLESLYVRIASTF